VVIAAPDRAEITLAVTTQGSTAQAAASQNATLTQQVLAAVRPIAGTKGEVKTANYSLNPEYDYSPNGSKPKLTGYRANNSIHVILDDLTATGKLIDAAIQAGATNIDGISFTLRDDASVRADALAQAAIKGKANAEAIAKALGVRVLGVLSVETIDSPILRPMPMMRMAAAEKAATPIQPGTLDVRASVVLTLLIE
jgi:uncharacterized protein